MDYRVFIHGASPFEIRSKRSLLMSFDGTHQAESWGQLYFHVVCFSDIVLASQGFHGSLTHFNIFEFGHLCSSIEQMDVCFRLVIHGYFGDVMLNS